MRSSTRVIDKEDRSCVYHSGVVRSGSFRLTKEDRLLGL
jgi:hypothetical protein